jgi:single-strand selective monofunctional uracil DNA glycosylase
MKMSLIELSRELCKQVEPLRFAAPVVYIYNPLAYAWAGHREYLERYGTGRKRVLLLGMNPGPFGMAQTGVPFGDVCSVRDWMKITAAVSRPDREHPKRPVSGFECKRREISGSRLWGWAEARFGTPERFFEQFFVFNYCPLAFMEESGKNLTPDKLPAVERIPLFEACDLALRRVVAVLDPEFVIGVGAFAEQRARAALSGAGVTIGTILHPSPASPKANRDWAAVAEEQLRRCGVQLSAFESA